LIYLNLRTHFKINFVYMQESSVSAPVKEGNKTVGVRGFVGTIWYILEKRMNFT